MKLRYLKLFLVLLPVLLVACGGSENDPPVSGDNPPVENILVLKGKLPSIEGGADVVLSAGGASYEGVADGAGNYEIEVPLDEIEGNPLLTLDTRGASEPKIRFATALGEFESIVEQAGADLIADMADVKSLNVRPIDIAAYAGVFEANGHEVPDTRLHVAELERDRVDMEALFKASALIDMWSGGFEAPAGAEDTWALLTDREALLEFVRNGGKETVLEKASAPGQFKDEGGDFDTLLSASLTEILVNAEAFTADTVPASYSVVEVARSTGEMKGFSVEFEGDGTGTLQTPAGVSTMTWQLDTDGAIQITPDETTVVMLESDQGPEGPYSTSLTISGIFMELMRSDDLADLLRVSVTYTEQRSDTLDDPLYPLEREFGRFAVGVKPDSHAQLSAEDVVGDWVMTGIAVDGWLDGYRDDANYDRQLVTGGSLHLLNDWEVRFQDDGQGQVPAFGDTFTWSIDDQGRLRMVYPDGVELRLTAIRKGSPMTDFFAEALMPNGAVYANGMYALKLPDAAPTLSEEEMVGYHVRFGVDDFNITAYGVLRHTIPLQHGQVSDVLPDFARTYVEDPHQWVPEDSDRRWYVGTDNMLHVDLVNRVTSDGGGGTLGSDVDPHCVAETENERCIVAESYQLQPLLQDGHRMYYLESVRWNYQNPESGEPVVNDNDHLVYPALISRSFLTYREQLTPEEAVPAPDITVPPDE